MRGLQYYETPSQLRVNRTSQQDNPRVPAELENFIQQDLQQWIRHLIAVVVRNSSFYGICRKTKCESTNRQHSVGPVASLSTLVGWAVALQVQLYFWCTKVQEYNHPNSSILKQSRFVLLPSLCDVFCACLRALLSLWAVLASCPKYPRSFSHQDIDSMASEAKMPSGNKPFMPSKKNSTKTVTARKSNTSR